MLWDKANRGRQAKYPDTRVVQWVARNFYDAPNRSAVRFLDIGCGRHAPHSRFLENEGFQVVSLDFSAVTPAHIHADIREVNFKRNHFDCILDFNTLCHVERPPIAKIKSWLKPGGLFFSVAPTAETWGEHLKGKGYCRCLTSEELFSIYSPPFDPEKMKWGYQSYAFEHPLITSWLVECRK